MKFSNWILNNAVNTAISLPVKFLAAVRRETVPPFKAVSSRQSGRYVVQLVLIAAILVSACGAAPVIRGPYKNELLYATTGRLGITSLHHAAGLGDVEATKSIIEYARQNGFLDKYINVRNDTNFTPLINAVWRNKVETATLLLENGADPNIVANYETSNFIFKGTALHTAVKTKNGAENFYQLLVSYGASLDIPNRNGVTVRQILAGQSDDPNQFQWGKLAAMAIGAAAGGAAGLDSATQIDMLTGMVADSMAGQEGISNTQRASTNIIAKNQEEERQLRARLAELERAKRQAPQDAVAQQESPQQIASPSTSVVNTSSLQRDLQYEQCKTQNSNIARAHRNGQMLNQSLLDCGDRETSGVSGGNNASSSAESGRKPANSTNGYTTDRKIGINDNLDLLIDQNCFTFDGTAHYKVNFRNIGGLPITVVVTAVYPDGRKSSGESFTVKAGGSYPNEWIAGPGECGTLRFEGFTRFKD